LCSCVIYMFYVYLIIIVFICPPLQQITRITLENVYLLLLCMSVYVNCNSLDKSLQLRQDGFIRYYPLGHRHFCLTLNKH
jgi:hypothetical protein